MDASGFLASDEPAHWSIYWEVEDAAAAVVKVKGLGGAVVAEAQDTPYGQIATVSDPAGAVFRDLQPLGDAGPPAFAGQRSGRRRARARARQPAPAVPPTAGASGQRASASPPARAAPAPGTTGSSPRSANTSLAVAVAAETTGNLNSSSVPAIAGSDGTHTGGQHGVGAPRCSRPRPIRRGGSRRPTATLLATSQTHRVGHLDAVPTE